MPAAALSVVSMFRPLTTPQLTFDIVVAALCVLLRSTLPFDSAAGWIMLVLMGGALAIRRLSPALALAVAWVGAIIQMAALLPPDAANLAILAVLFATARYGTPPVRWAGLASAVLGAVIATTYFLLLGFTAVSLTPNPHLVIAGAFSLGASLAVLGLSWTIGLLVRTWDTARESRRNQEIAEREVVIEQERNRIARDMHDVVAHSLAVVIAQADGARYAAAADPQVAEQALGTIASTAREALADVRLLLGQLRHSQEPGPQPVLADLDTLFDQLRASGLDITVTEHGTAPTLPASQQLAIYRITQEALTNALRHGDPSGRVSLDLDWQPDAATLTITNALRSGPQLPSHPGHGLTGMLERASLVGGTVAAAPAGNSFVVVASIPVPVVTA